MDKRSLRKRFRGKGFDSSISSAIVANIRRADFYQKAPLILTYMPLLDEADISPMLSDSRCFAIPYIEDYVMHFSLYDGDTVKGAYGIDESRRRSECAYPCGTVALVPALAFTEEGFRLGRGKGYYDSFFALHSGILKVGVIPKERIVTIDDLRAEDIPMDLLVTQEGVIRLQ